MHKRRGRPVRSPSSGRQQVWRRTGRPAQGCEPGATARDTRPLAAPGKPVCEPHDSTGEPGAGNRPAGFGERGEETCLRVSDCGPARKRRMSHRTLPVTRLPSTLPVLRTAGLDPAAGRSQPAPRHPRGTRERTTSASTTSYRGDRLRTGVREAPAARRADERPPARRPPGRQRTLAASAGRWVRSITPAHRPRPSRPAWSTRARPGRHPHRSPAEDDRPAAWRSTRWSRPRQGSRRSGRHPARSP